MCGDRPYLENADFVKKPLMNRNVLYALLAVALFGASTPFAKLLLGSAGNFSPVLLAGLLYLDGS
jgi:hypothetical protein